MEEDGDLGRESHTAETSDFLCLLSKVVTVPDPWRMGGSLCEHQRQTRSPKRQPKVPRII